MSAQYQGGGHLVGLGLDFRHAVRGLTKSWTFTAVCLTSLAIGVAINAIIFLFAKRTFDPPAAVTATNAVELLMLTRGLALDDLWSYPDVMDVRRADTGMDIAGFSVGWRNLRRDDGADGGPISVMYSSANYFRVLGVGVERGRGFLPEEDDAITDVPIVISHSLWRSRLGSDPQVVGRTLIVNRARYHVVGVAASGFDGHSAGHNVDAWLPLREHPLLRSESSTLTDRGAGRFELIGRLRNGTSIARADGALKGVMQGLADAHPSTNAIRSATVVPYSVQGGGDSGSIAKALFLSMSGMVLLVVCMNVAGMVLVRTAARERELALHLAIGSSRLRLVRHLMMESAVIAVLGSLLSIGFVWLVLRLLAWWSEQSIPLDFISPVVPVCLGLSFATTLAIGLSPALRYSRLEILPSLKDDVGGGRRRSSRIHHFATSVQTAVALPLLVINGMVLQGTKLMDVADYGFDQDQLLVATLDFDAEGFSDDHIEPFLRQLRESVSTLSGVASVSVADGVPLDYGGRTRRLSRAGEQGSVWIQGTRVDERYFDTIGAPLLRGRGFEQRDRSGSEAVAVVTQSLAGQLWPGQEALGQRVVCGFDRPGNQELTIVGIVADVVGSSHESPPTNIYVPIWQHPAKRVMLVVRAPSEAVAPAIADVAAQIDPALTKPAVVTARSLMADAKSEINSMNIFIGGLSVLTLMLAAVGVYGVIAFAVAHRTREIGVRMAMGASRRRVVQMVLGEGVKLAVPGVVVGSLLSAALVQAVLGEWYNYFDRSAIDFVQLSAGAAVALMVVLLASSMPARRAAGVQPMEALRRE
jgi:predicted permease